MIVVHLPLKREYVIQLLNGKTIQGNRFTFVKEERIKLYFEVTGDPEKAVKTIKEEIKNSPYGNILFFNVSIEDEQHFPGNNSEGTI